MKNDIDNVVSPRFQLVQEIVHPKRKGRQRTIRFVTCGVRHSLPPEVVEEELAKRSFRPDVRVLLDSEPVIMN